MMRLPFLLLITGVLSCNIQNKNKLIGKWQLIKKSNDHEVIFEYNPGSDLKKYIYWFKNDSTLITQDDDGGNTQLNKYFLSSDKIVLFDSLHANTFFFKMADSKLSLKSIYSPFNLELQKLD